MDPLSDPATLALIQATIAHYGDATEGEVLERLGHAEARYADACLSFAEAQAKPKKQRDHAAMRAYATRFREVSKRLEETRPPIESLGPLHAPPATVGMSEPPVAPAADVAAPTRPPRVEVSPLSSVEPEPVASRRAPAWATPSYLQSSISSVQDVDVTAELKLPPGGVLAEAKPLPFRDALPGEVPAILSDMDTVLAETPRGSTTGTDELPVLDASARPIPFEHAPRVAPGSRITFLQYGEILAEIGIDPSREARVWSRYGVVSIAEQREIEASFRGEFDRDPTLRAELGELVRRHRARLLGR